MTKSPIGLDIIELKKRYKQHKADMHHISDSVYLDFNERCFQIRKKKMQFFKSLRAREVEYIQELAIIDLGGIPDE